PQPTVRMRHDVVRAVQQLAVCLFAQHGDASVVLGARDTPALACDEPTLEVARVTVGIVRRRAEHRHLAALFGPAQDPVVRNVAPEQITTVAEPYRPFCPAAAGLQSLDRRCGNAVLREARIDDFDTRIGITHRIASARGETVGCECCGCRAGPEERATLHGCAPAVDVAAPPFASACARMKWRSASSCASLRV